MHRRLGGWQVGRLAGREVGRLGGWEIRRLGVCNTVQVTPTSMNLYILCCECCDSTGNNALIIDIT